MRYLISLSCSVHISPTIETTYLFRGGVQVKGMSSFLNSLTIMAVCNGDNETLRWQHWRSVARVLPKGGDMYIGIL